MDFKNKNESTWKDKKWRSRIREKYPQSEHNCVSVQKKGNPIADILSLFNEKTEYGPLCVCVQFVCKHGLNHLCMMLANYFPKHK